MTSAWKDQPRGQPANAGQFGSKPKVRADTPEAPAVDLGGHGHQVAADPLLLAKQALLDSLPEDSATVIYTSDDLDASSIPYPWEDGILMTSEGGIVPFPEDDRGRATAEVLSLCERAFSDKAWGDHLSDQGIMHAESYDRPPSESSCLDMADRYMALLAEDPDLLGDTPLSLAAQPTMPSEMPVTAGDRHHGFRWMPASPTAEPPVAGVVYWSVGRLEDHDDRTQDVLNPEERSIRMGYMDTVYDDDSHEHRSMYLRMMSFEGYDEKRGHLKGYTETLVRYTMPNETDIYGHVMAGYTKERERQRNAGR